MEIHTWNSTEDDLDRPNRIVWDLDPGPEAPWKQVSPLKLVRDVLKTLGLESWVKTTGGRGLHVIVPVRPAHDWLECLEFARDVGEAIERTDPLYTTTFAKASRESKIQIDYLRNNRTNTSVCAFSPRAKAGARVSTPLDWRELTRGPERWTLLTVPQRLARLKADPWQGYWLTKQKVTRTSVAALRRL